MSYPAPQKYVVWRASHPTTSRIQIEARSAKAAAVEFGVQTYRQTGARFDKEKVCSRQLGATVGYVYTVTTSVSVTGLTDGSEESFPVLAEKKRGAGVAIR
jgi:hypothetical protein